MKSELCNEILSSLEFSFSGEQLKLIETAIYNSLNNYTLSKEQIETALTIDLSPDAKAYQMFFISKKIEGLSERSLKYYKAEIKHFIEFINKPLKHITSDDLRYYFATRGNISNVYVRNKQNVLSSFFSWLADEEYIPNNPMKKLKKIKVDKKIMHPFSNDEIEMLKDACKDKREKAVISLLLSTGMRCGELYRANISDVNFSSNEIKVLGKGNKERFCYLNAAAKKHLIDYLGTRSDNFPSLITSVHNRTFCSKENRVGITGIEIFVRKLGKRAGVSNTHPHRFRRTFATTALKRGATLEQVQRMLGHEKIDTTLKYAIIADNTVKISHERYL